MRKLCLVGLLIWPFSLYATPWEQLKSPSSQPSQSIGSYANGCIAGAEPLPLQGEGYQVLRSQRARYYAHPQTIEYIESLAAKVNASLNTNLLVGDLSLPQGGRFSSGHSSHQTGLDIDIWLRLSSVKLNDSELAKPEPVSVVNLQQYRLTRENWQQKHFQLIKMAASYDQVARIFVHPVIKQQLCDSEPSEERAWLRKVRPWWGHHYHMHVRLNCPEGDRSCTPQAPPPRGDGCGAELASWKPQPKPKIQQPVATKTPTKKPSVKRMPSQCMAMLEQSTS
ncbi:penicillin-insensitive murein endopeptidase [Vibrio sp. V39_P1S14PM300]|uniref:penicillin-insensitive murein endopeptidase n=1 Tax=Vibrio sp. V39_P1S14PM300 TaxID=1938690 RepID=UPI0013724ED2|nr:penicillin-insensitive murein endopeptidase [Vibrio sp. V39_P1S14PM300]NAX20699.1 penicillin-insensitive murein endopeptidase [Vibrio sp. V39_P1S14PM300]